MLDLLCGGSGLTWHRDELSTTKMSLEGTHQHLQMPLITMPLEFEAITSCSGASFAHNETFESRRLEQRPSHTANRSCRCADMFVGVVQEIE